VDMPYTSNLDRSRKLFRRTVATLCQPLVHINDAETPHGIVTTCTLAHATVRDFLIKRASWNDLPISLEVNVTPDTLANICLRYLMQSRFTKLLHRDDGDFRDTLEDDINNQHLLPYAAKYWDKHLDEAKEWKVFCDIVEAFVHSSQFYTCLQVQSLLVAGKSFGVVK
jgi:hypothetical protein